ncbi:MAG: 50S ribosomal protein L9 [Planctomycetota bacterium]|jgi:large subunit ribosomal protein L9
MKVLLRRNVSKLGHIGEVVDVKPGYARNYLIPEGVAVQPTEANLRAIEMEKQQYLEELAKQRTELEAKAAVVQGREITIFARANEEGHLYGSIGPAQIVAALAAENVFIEPQHVVLPEPIRQLDKYDVTVRFSDEVTATIHLWVVPVREEGEEGESEQGESEPFDNLRTSESEQERTEEQATPIADESAPEAVGGEGEQKGPEAADEAS